MADVVDNDEDDAGRVVVTVDDGSVVGGGSAVKSVGERRESGSECRI